MNLALVKEERQESAREKTKRLNSKGKPIIRDLDPFDPEEKDYKVLWAAYLRGAFDLEEGLQQKDFYLEVDALYNANTRILMVEDASKINNNEYAPIGFIGEKSDGWRVEPHFEHFPWATPQNKLRMCVNYLRMMKNADIGVVEARVLEADLPFFNRVTTYGVLFPYGHPLGVIRNGHPKGDIHLYQLRGKEAFREQAV